MTSPIDLLICCFDYQFWEATSGLTNGELAIGWSAMIRTSMLYVHPLKQVFHACPAISTFLPAPERAMLKF